jgi:hypothetical protein
MVGFDGAALVPALQAGGGLPQVTQTLSISSAVVERELHGLQLLST